VLANLLNSPPLSVGPIARRSVLSKCHCFTVVATVFAKVLVAAVLHPITTGCAACVQFTVFLRVYVFSYRIGPTRTPSQSQP